MIGYDSEFEFDFFYFSTKSIKGFIVITLFSLALTLFLAYTWFTRLPGIESQEGKLMIGLAMSATMTTFCFLFLVFGIINAREFDSKKVPCICCGYKIPIESKECPKCKKPFKILDDIHLIKY